MNKEDIFNKYLNNTEFEGHNYIGSGAFSLGLNAPGNNVNDLPDHMSLDQFNGINPSYIGNEGALLDPTYLNEVPIDQNLGCNQSGHLVDNTIGSLSEPVACLGQYTKLGYAASEDCFTTDELRIGFDWINEESSAIQAESEYIVNADMGSLGPPATAQVWNGTANAQFQETECLIAGTVTSGIWDESKSLEKDISGFEINTPNCISELETNPSDSIVLSDIAGASHLLTDNPSYLGGIPFEKLENAPEVVVNSFDQTTFCIDHRVMGTDSISYPNINLDASFLNQKGSNHTWDFAQAYPEQVQSDYKTGSINDSILYSDIEELNPISGTLDSFTKDDSISGFRDLSISSQKKIEGIVENILPEQVGQVEFGVNLSTEQNNYTLNIMIFINGDISGDKSQIGHTFNFN